MSPSLPTQPLGVGELRCRLLSRWSTLDEALSVWRGRRSHGLPTKFIQLQAFSSTITCFPPRARWPACQAFRHAELDKRLAGHAILGFYSGYGSLCSHPCRACYAALRRLFAGVEARRGTPRGWHQVEAAEALRPVPEEHELSTAQPCLEARAASFRVPEWARLAS